MGLSGGLRGAGEGWEADLCEKLAGEAFELGGSLRPQHLVPAAGLACRGSHRPLLAAATWGTLNARPTGTSTTIAFNWDQITGRIGVV
jgi:hypothetical protein